MCRMNPKVYSLEFGGTKVGQQHLIRAFAASFKILPGGVFSDRQNPQAAECTAYGLCILKVGCETRLFLIETIRPLQSTSPFINCGSAAAGAKSIESQRARVYEFQKRWISDVEELTAVLWATVSGGSLQIFQLSLINAVSVFDQTWVLRVVSAMKLLPKSTGMYLTLPHH